MRKRKQRTGGATPGDRALGVRHEDIQADVFELWIGISRLMARVSGPDHCSDAGHHVRRGPDRYR